MFVYTCHLVHRVRSNWFSIVHRRGTSWLFPGCVSGLNSFLAGPIKAPCEDTNLTGQMHRQFWVFAALQRTYFILWVLLCILRKLIDDRERRWPMENVHLEPGLWCVCFRCILSSINWRHTCMCTRHRFIKVLFQEQGMITTEDIHVQAPI